MNRKPSKIAELKQLTESLNMRDLRRYYLEMCVESMPIGLLVVDPSGEIFFTNKEAEEALEAKENLVGKNIEEAFGKFQFINKETNDKIEKKDSSIARAFQGHKTRGDVVLSFDDGHKRELHIWGTPVYNGGDHVKFALVAFTEI